MGVPTVCTVIRLADWPEGGYSNSDKDKPEIGLRRGEVLIGYYQQTLMVVGYVFLLCLVIIL